MTEQEAIENLNELLTMCDFKDEYGEFTDTEPYEKSVDMAIQALEKQIARKPIRKPNLDWTNEEVTCPGCSRNVSEYRNKYCDCGQKLDWSEEE